MNQVKITLGACIKNIFDSRVEIGAGQKNLLRLHPKPPAPGGSGNPDIQYTVPRMCVFINVCTGHIRFISD